MNGLGVGRNPMLPSCYPSIRMTSERRDADPSINGDRAALTFDRAVGELRRGRAIRITDGDRAMLAGAIETLQSPVFSRLVAAGAGRCVLLVTAERARAAGLAQQIGGAVALALPPEHRARRACAPSPASARESSSAARSSRTRSRRARRSRLRAFSLRKRAASCRRCSASWRAIGTRIPGSYRST